jgi:hypothetical protein
LPFPYQYVPIEDQIERIRVRYSIPIGDDDPLKDAIMLSPPAEERRTRIEYRRNATPQERKRAIVSPCDQALPTHQLDGYKERFPRLPIKKLWEQS